MACAGSPPTVSLVARDDFQTFNEILYTAGSSARCVLQYSLTITENREPLTTMTIDSSGTGSVGCLNLCKNIYTFSAVGVTMGMNCSSNGPVAGLVDFTGMLLLSIFNCFSKLRGTIRQKLKQKKLKFFPSCSCRCICLLVAIFHVLEVYCLLRFLVEVVRVHAISLLWSL